MCIMIISGACLICGSLGNEEDESGRTWDNAPYAPGQPMGYSSSRAEYCWKLIDLQFKNYEPYSDQYQTPKSCIVVSEDVQTLDIIWFNTRNFHVFLKKEYPIYVQEIILLQQGIEIWWIRPVEKFAIPCFSKVKNGNRRCQNLNLVCFVL